MNTFHAVHQIPLQRRRLRIRGLVQGVGFRPHVYRCAEAHDVTGFVQNGPDGVVVEAEGQGLDAFVEAIVAGLPPLARIDSLISSDLPIVGGRGFEIRPTAEGGLASAAIPADTALCRDCLNELFDRSNRRHLHPFIACTNCGPRFTMTRSLPYDRCSTSMADFPLCDACEQEYTSPASRRFHAEPVCCHECGPSLSHSIEHIAAALQAGEIVAIKGLGGFHLACNAHDADAVTRLRARKQRDARPFAVMVLNRASAGHFAQLTPREAALLESVERPVVVLGSRHKLPHALSPGLDTLGLMLPYTGVHYLLFHALLGAPAATSWLDAPNNLALVMTSANISGDPLVIDNAEARERLGNIADLVVEHDREISARTDDSVARVVRGDTVLLRRARGFVPRAIALAESGHTVLALGAHLKNTVTLARGRQAWLSTHVGDLDNANAIGFQREVIEQLLTMMQSSPEAVACDWHRDYASTRLAESLAEEHGIPLLRVQHHHAHLAAVLASHGCEHPALGVALDGHGLGENGESWGGELMRLDGATFDRLGHFAALPAPGGDRAAREPWRMAAGALFSLGRADQIAQRFATEPMAPPLHDLLVTGDVDCTTAAGRLFDAAAGLLGVSRRAAYEGEAPMQLEALVGTPQTLAGGYRLEQGVLDFSPLLAALADCDNPVTGAELFHGTLTQGLADWIVDAAARNGLKTVALAGGCFLNRVLAADLPAKLQAAGLQPLLAKGIPPNDGSISLGQAWVARRCLSNHAEDKH